MLIKRLILLAALASVLSMSSAYAGGRHHKASNCEQSAKTMFRACHFDVADDLNETIASCQHIADQGDRWDCYIGAYDARSDDSEECGDVYEARVDACDLLEEDRYDPDPLLGGGFVNFEDVEVEEGELPVDYTMNPFVSVEPGHTYVLRAGEEEEELVIVHVTDDYREVRDVTCRIVVDIVFEVEDSEYEVVEATEDLFAIKENGDVVYCGEVSRNYEDGVLRDLDGSFESGIEWAKAGYLIKAAPVPPDVHRQEFLPGEAEDIVQYVSTTGSPTEENPNPLFQCAGGCLKTSDFAPLDPESTEFKYYLTRVESGDPGFVLAEGMEDGVIVEREVLLCVGDSLDVLETEACGFADDHEAVMEELCKISPDAFCPAEDD